MHFARRSIAVATALALTTPLPGRAEESDAAVTESPSTATEKKSQRTDLPETELQELRVQAAPDSDRFRATEATTGALGERPLVDTPFSINVITDALIRNQQNDTPQDVFKNDPSFASGNVPVPFSTLRGFAIGDNGYLYDGLPAFVGLSGARGQLQGIDRIEVLKGPSAFLNGIGASTSLGGTLNFIPKRPLAVPVREISASYASETLFGVHADIGDRFGADRQFGYRTNLAYRDGEQAIDGARWRQTVATFAADWRATPDLLLNATFDYVDNQTPRFQSFFAVVPGIAVPAAPDARRNLSFSWNDFHQQDYRGTVRADWSLNNDWSITAQALLGHTWRPTVFAGGFGLITSETGDTLTLNSANTLDSDYGSGQVLLHGKFVTGPLSHQFTAGGSASGNDQNSAQGSIAALPSNLYFPLDYFNQTPALPASAPYQKQRSYGALLSDIIGFGEQWSVLLGGRYADLSVDNYSLATGRVTDSSDVSKTTPAVALMFKPIPDALLYANYALRPRRTLRDVCLRQAGQHSVRGRERRQSQLLAECAELAAHAQHSAHRQADGTTGFLVVPVAPGTTNEIGEA
jgi:iron complex outermembrane receptor protein